LPRLPPIFSTTNSEAALYRSMPKQRSTTPPSEVAAAERRGRNVSMADAQIAAICARNKATLATRNTRDFEHFPIPLINPWHE